MFTIAALMVLGILIEQGETPDFYFKEYPEDNHVLGFFTWRWIFTMRLDHMYSAHIFLGMLVLLAASLMACTYTSQIPFVKVFMKGPSLYAFKGLAGRFVLIGVHIAMLLIMLGGTLSTTRSFRGSVTVPQGLNFVMGDVLGLIGFLSIPTDTFNTKVQVNRYTMDL